MRSPLTMLQVESKSNRIHEAYAYAFACCMGYTPRRCRRRRNMIIGGSGGLCEPHTLQCLRANVRILCAAVGIYFKHSPPLSSIVKHFQTKHNSSNGTDKRSINCRLRVLRAHQMQCNFASSVFTKSIASMRTERPRVAAQSANGNETTNVSHQRRSTSSHYCNPPTTTILAGHLTDSARQFQLGWSAQNRSAVCGCDRSATLSGHPLPCARSRNGSLKFPLSLKQ